MLERVPSISKLARWGVKFLRTLENTDSSSALLWMMHRTTFANSNRLRNLLLVVPGIFILKRWYHKTSMRYTLSLLSGSTRITASPSARCGISSNVVDCNRRNSCSNSNSNCCGVNCTCFFNFSATNSTLPKVHFWSKKFLNRACFKKSLSSSLQSNVWRKASIATHHNAKQH